MRQQIFKSHINCTIRPKVIANMDDILSRKIYDMVMLDEIPAKDYLKEDKDNIVFSDRHRNVYGSSISRLKKAIHATNLVIECNGPKAGAITLNDVINNAWYYRIGMDVINSALSVRCVRRIIFYAMNGARVFGIDEKTRLDYTVTLKNVLGPDGRRSLTGSELDYTSSTHCNTGSEIYIWKNVFVLIAPHTYTVEGNVLKIQ